MTITSFRLRPLVIAAGVAVALVGPATAQLANNLAAGNKAAYISFQVGGLPTFPQSINDALTVAGYYTDSGGVQHGFIRDIFGRITRFEARRQLPPASSCSAPLPDILQTRAMPSMDLSALPAANSAFSIRREV